jgi:DNA-binding PadR family transcriptional regulator
MLDPKELKEFHRSIVKSFLDTVVLARLRNCGRLNGYELIEYVHQKFGVLISSGTLYSLLYALERKGLIKGEWVSGKRLYVLTDKGCDSITAILESKEEIQRFMRKVLEN